jgi:hypothetical protein
MRRLTTAAVATAALLAVPGVAFAVTGGKWTTSSSNGTGAAKAISIAISSASAAKSGNCTGTGSHTDPVSVNWSGNALTGQSWAISATKTGNNGANANFSGTFTASQPPVAISLVGQNTHAAVHYTLSITVSMGTNWSSTTSTTYDTVC